MNNSIICVFSCNTSVLTTKLYPVVFKVLKLFGKKTDELLTDNQLRSEFVTPENMISLLFKIVFENKYAIF